MRKTLLLVGLLVCMSAGLAFSQVSGAVEDYKGPDGSGDQGGYVMLSLKNSQPGLYRVWREIQVSVAVSTDGRIVILETPQHQWIPWVVVDVPVGSAGTHTIVVPALDNTSTRWTVTPWPNIPRRFAADTDEQIQEGLALLGIQSVMRRTEMEKVLGSSYDFRRVLLGDQNDIVLGELELGYLRGVASGITAITFEPTERLVTEPIRAIDNIPPAAVTGEKAKFSEGRMVTLTWIASMDDRIVGFIPYKGHAVPIPGVRTYDVWRGTDEGDLVKITSLSPGTTSFTNVVPADFGDKVVYRINATDLDNATLGRIIKVDLTNPILVDGNQSSKMMPSAVQATPAEFSLKQNFPNPFNPETTIKYDLAEEGQTILRIYNMAGQVVRTLVNEHQAAGRYSIRWDGKDERGLLVSSGMYFYGLSAGRYTSVKKLMLLK